MITRFLKLKRGWTKCNPRAIPTAQDLQTINGVLFKVVDGDRFLGVVGVERQVAQVVVGGGGIGQFAAFAASGGQGRRRRDAFGGDRNHGGGVFFGAQNKISIFKFILKYNMSTHCGFQVGSKMSIVKWKFVVNQSRKHSEGHI